MKILAFAGSNSEESINKKLVTSVAKSFNNDNVEILDLNDFEMPIYKNEREKTTGIPKLAYDFAEKIDESDLLLISLAEHNGAYSTAFKNIFDWVSRIPGRHHFGDKPTFLMATSPGKMGGSTVLNIAANRLPFNGAKVIDIFSLPFFFEFFNSETGEIINEDKAVELKAKVEKIKNELAV
ncbi:NAD(P)H-dependent FMN reductase [Halpernia humi]|uniref:NAD(P)H-dependent FMN reductase n=1 Tax=Halpernia humi TaxID=493375 RepID=A0A1H5TE11_9FLAO|nr:NAD(P)H-dependent oxidoreductase [Halpernia humi]SEF61085.1 NAD(P)H-dependent FMN reductase [Halpernia humi]